MFIVVLSAAVRCYFASLGGGCAKGCGSAPSLPGAVIIVLFILMSNISWKLPPLDISWTYVTMINCEFMLLIELPNRLVFTALSANIFLIFEADHFVLNAINLRVSEYGFSLAKYVFFVVVKMVLKVTQISGTLQPH